MMRYLCLLVMMFIYAIAAADTLPFELSITGKNFDVRESLELSGVGEGKTRIGRDFKDKFGKPFRFDLNYKALPENRSYPANLDITVSDGSGEKLGYLFFANNGVQLYAPLADDLPVMAVESGRAQHADPVVCRLEHGGLQFVRPRTRRRSARQRIGCAPSVRSESGSSLAGRRGRTDGEGEVCTRGGTISGFLTDLTPICRPTSAVTSRAGKPCSPQTLSVSSYTQGIRM